jgi:hypothetical protein
VEENVVVDLSTTTGEEPDRARPAFDGRQNNSGGPIITDTIFDDICHVTERLQGLHGVAEGNFGAELVPEVVKDGSLASDPGGEVMDSLPEGREFERGRGLEEKLAVVGCDGDLLAGESVCNQVEQRGVVAPRAGTAA